MGAFSVWHWLLVLAVVGVPAWLLVRHVRRRRTDLPNTAALAGIDGWLGLLAFGLCLGFLRSAVELVQGLPVYLSGFRNSAAQVQLVTVGLYALVSVATHLWAVVALFQKKRVFRAA